MTRPGNTPYRTGFKIAKARDAGLFSNFATVIGLLHETECEGLSPVVNFDQGPYLDPSIGPNWWEYFFEPIGVDWKAGTGGTEIAPSELGHLAGTPWRLGLTRTAPWSPSTCAAARDNGRS